MASEQAVAEDTDEQKLVAARDAMAIAADHLVEALDALGYKCVVWREDWDETKRAEYWDERQERVAPHIDNGTLWGELKGRDDWDAAQMLAEELDEDEVKNVCGEKGIELAEDDDLRPVAVAAVRVAYAGMHELFDRLAELKALLRDRNMHSAAAAELALRGA